MNPLLRKRISSKKLLNRMENQITIIFLDGEQVFIYYFFFASHRRELRALILNAKYEKIHNLPCLYTFALGSVIHFLHKYV